MSRRDTHTNRERKDNLGKRAARHGLVSLSPKELRFIDEYMVDRCARRAAIRVGYSERSAVVKAPKLLAREEIRAEIARRDAERQKRVDVKIDDVLLELKRMAFFDVRSLFNPDGSLRQNIHEMTEDQARALVNFDIVTLDKEGNYIVKLNPGNKLKALELLGKHLKLFTDVVENKGTVVNYHADFGIDDEDE